MIPAPRRFPFDHLTLADVALCDRLREWDQAGRLSDKGYSTLHRLLPKRHPPLYGPAPARGDAA